VALNSSGSYVKTTAASLALVAVGSLLLALAVIVRLPPIVAALLGAVGLVVALGAAMATCAGAVVLVRHRRDARGERDLFLELNRSREASAVKATGPRHVTRLRRWLARHLLGHELIVGDLVEVKSWTEISATLDDKGCLEQLPFMPEMRAMCGRRAYVFRGMHRLFDYRKTRQMRHMDGAVLLVEAVCDGSSHGGCEAGCHTIWKAAWLRRVHADGTAVEAPRDRSDSQHDAAQPIPVAPYTCQLTQLHAASRPIGNRNAANFLRPLISGNVTVSAFLVGWLTYVFNEIQHLRQGTAFPSFADAVQDAAASADIHPMPGDRVVVRSAAEIRSTLNDRLEHRGMGFEPDMLKHCGREYCVQARIGKVIDLVTGEMRTLKTPAYLLRGVHFSGERQFFNAQYEPLFWRAAWMRMPQRCSEPTAQPGEVTLSKLG
jgi:hypothetical protein